MEDRIDSYVDLEATGRETEAFLKQLNAIYAVYKGIKDTKLNLRASDNFSETTKRTKDLSAAMKEQERIEKDLEKTATKIAALETQKAKALAITKVELQKNTAELKNQIREQNAAEGSLEKLRATLIRLNKEYDNLSKVEREAGNGQGLKKQISELDAELKRLEGDTGRFQRNVGNYANAFGSALGTVEKSLSKIRQDINSGAGGSQQVEQLRKQEELLVKVTAQLGQQFTSTKQQSRAFQEAAAQIGIAFGQTSEQFQNFRAQVGEGVDALNDIRNSIKLAASDTQQFDKLIGAASAIAGGFSVAQGAAALFGKDNEELQKTFVKLQAAMTILNGLQAIQNELRNKDSVLSKVRIALFGQQNKLIAGQAVAQGANAAATNAAATATNRFSVALKGIGIGLLLSAIPVIIGLLSKFGSKTEEIDDDLKGFGKTVDEIASGVLDELKSSISNLNDELGQTPGTVEKAAKAMALLSKEINQITAAQETARKQFGFESFNKIIEFGAKGVGLLTDNLGDLNKQLQELGKEKKTLEFLQSIKAQVDFLNAVIERNATFQKNSAELDKDAAGRRLTAIKKDYEKRALTEVEFLRKSYDAQAEAYNNEIELINLNALDQINAAEGNSVKIEAIENTAFKERTIAYRNYQDKLTEINETAEKGRLKITAQTIQQVVDIEESALSKMAEAVNKIEGNPIADKLQADVDKFMQIKDQLKKELADLRAELGKTFVDAFLGLAGSSFDVRKNAIQDEINKLEEKKQKEIEVANATIQNEQDKAAAITVIEARAAAEKERFERQKKQVDIQKARFEKVAAILSISIDTIQKVAAIRAQAAVLLANPLTAPLAPLALAQIPFVIGMAAISSAAIAAKPIPKFKHGRKGGPATMAIVGDGGRSEVVTDRDGSNPMLTPARDTYAYLQEGAKVFPSEKDYADALLNGSIKQPGNVQIKENSDGSFSVVRELRTLKNAIVNKRELYFHWDNGQLATSVKTGSAFTHYVNKNVYE
jgi:hypothetical protein